MDLEKLIQTKEFLEGISRSIRNIIHASFPRTSSDDKEDIEQEVKLKIWKKIASGKKIANLRSYLWKVVYTASLDVMGERIRGSSLNEALEQADSLTISELDLFPPDSIWEKEEMKNIVKRAVRGLPPRRRTVLELHLAGMKLEEMAAFLGWTDNQVRHLLYRGKEE